MDAEARLLLDALGRAVAGRQVSLCLDVDWQKVMKLAGSHMLLPLLYDGLHRSAADWEQVPEPAREFLYQHFMRAVYRDSQFDHIRQQLTEKLTEAGVDHIFLKGAVLKQDYPVPALRTMCDMDVLVHTADYGKIAEIASQLGGSPGHSDGNHRNFSFPGGVTVEFHPNLLHHGTPVGTGINPGWQYARPGAGGTMALTEEGIYLNTLCHLANHFVSGGVGVRFVLDVWVSRHLRTPQPDRNFVEAELKKFGMLDFACHVEALAEAWFGHGDPAELPEGLEEYILSSGSHGLSERAMLNAVALSPGGSQSSALLKKAFYSREELEDRFPWCKGKAWLLPAAWCTRAFRAVTRHGSKVLQWGKGTGKITRNEAEDQRRLLQRFGIDPKTKE